VYLREHAAPPVKAIEMPFRIPLVDREMGEVLDLPLDGFIDLIEEGDIVVELKTAAGRYTLLDLTHQLQLTT